ncbi:MAG TPA: class I SAM-dependent methyltransferase [Terriglobales bacterium]|nr:class I SAM-dependent methyltransferase [Terriglobales bacterium]
MITHIDNYVEYCRQTARELRDPHDLALRGRDKHRITRIVHEDIARAVKLSPDDDLVEIGCGDGTLLRIAHTLGVNSAIGLHATDEEAAIVRRMGLDARQGLSHRLPLENACASVVVCNNVLLIVPREQILPSLREIYRIARPGARVYLGEIPFVPGPPPERHFDTARETLSHLYRTHGLRTALGMARKMAYCKLTGEPIVIRNGAGVSFYAAPEEFIPATASVGLSLVSYWLHEHWAGRNNYLFTKSLSQACEN